MNRQAIAMAMAIWTGVSWASLDTKEAFYLKLDRAGVDLTAAELQRQHLGDINGAVLPNMEEEAFLGIKVRGEGIRYSVDFGDLRMVPANGSVGVNLGINRIRLDVSSLRFSKKLVFEISSTCRDTAVEVGVSRLSAQVALAVSNGHVTAGATQVNFPLGDDNFRVDGPRECSGVLGVGHLIKIVVKEVIKRSRGTIEEKITARVKEMLPTLEASLNRAVRREIPFEVENFIPIQDAAPVLMTSPHALSLTNAGLEFVLSVDVAREDADTVDDGFEFPLDGAMVGKAGVNPQLFTEVFEKIVPEGAWVTLSEELVPGLEDALKVEYASVIWPDLRQIALTKSYLRPMITFDGPPIFEVVQDEAVVRVKLPARILMQIHQDGWRNYFHVKLDVNLQAVLTIENGKLAVGLKPNTIVNVSGEWDPDYEPKDAHFEAEVAEVVFRTLFELLYAQGPLVRVDVPKIEFGGREVSVDNPSVGAPYILLDLVAN